VRLRAATCLAVLLLVLVGKPSGAVQALASPGPAPGAQANVSGIKDYMLRKTQAIAAGAKRMEAASATYYTLAREAGFDYHTLWTAQHARAWAAVRQARAAWSEINPLYEQMEGIVAGLAPLIKYDVILDSGSSAADNAGTVAPFDLHLPNGRVLRRPGNLYGVTESTLWGTFAAYTVPHVTISAGKAGFGEAVPDANVLASASAAFVSYLSALRHAELAWQPTVTDAFTCLTINVPTISDFFTVWRNSRFVMGNKATRHDFVVRSRLWDIVDNVGSWQVLYRGLSPLVRTVDPQRDTLILRELTDVRSFVLSLAQREKAGKHFTPEEADLLGAEAQNRATALTGQIAQVASELHVTLPQ